MKDWELTMHLVYGFTVFIAVAEKPSMCWQLLETRRMACS